MRFVGIHSQSRGSSSFFKLVPGDTDRYLNMSQILGTLLKTHLKKVDGGVSSLAAHAKVAPWAGWHTLWNQSIFTRSYCRGALISWLLTNADDCALWSALSLRRPPVLFREVAVDAEKLMRRSVRINVSDEHWVV
eukprot:6481441-Amphidinium_carterae.1